MHFEPQEFERLRLVSGDVLLAEASGSPSQVGRPAIWRDQIPECAFQNTVIRFRPIHATPEFAYIVFKFYARSGIFGARAKGAGIQHLGCDRFSSMPFPVPPIEEQHRIVAVTFDANEKLSSARKHLELGLVTVDELALHVLQKAVSAGLGTANVGDSPVQISGRQPKQKRARSTRTGTSFAQPSLLDMPEPSQPRRRSLEVVLRKSGALTAQELLEASGYNPEQPQEVNAFYDRLRLAIREGKVVNIPGNTPPKLKAAK
jgi:type I restriction enzyme S subunit